MSGILGSRGEGGNDYSGGENQIKEKLKKALALIANTASSGRVPQLDIGGPEQKEWKPSTKEEAIAFELAKRQPKEKDDVKDLEQGIKRKVANGEGLTQNEAAYANRFMRRSGDLNEFQAAESSEGEEKTSTSTSKSPKDWGDVGILDRIKAAITPSKTSTEQTLGALRPGGIFKPPQVNAESVLPGINIAQSAAQSLPSVTAAQKLSQLINSGGSAPDQESQGSSEKSPYQDYPDAFKENGVWKVVRDGKKYKLEIE